METTYSQTKTVQQIVSDLGGATAVATLCGGISSQAVSNWIAENHIPQAREIYLRAVRPDVFADMPEQKAAA